jgi:DNA-binding protein Fis
MAPIIGAVRAFGGARNRASCRGERYDARAGENPETELHAGRGGPWAFDRGRVMDSLQATKEFQALVDAALPTLVREAAVVESGKLYRSVMARIELPLLRQALELSGGNQLKAARLLGINRNTLRKRLRLLGLLHTPARNGGSAR